MVFIKGQVPPNKGKKASKETIEKLRISHLGKKNNLGKHWKVKDASNLKPNKTSFKKGHKGIGNIFKKGHGYFGTLSQFSYLPYSVDWTETLKISIRERDNYICQECGIHQYELFGRHKKLDVHHIDYNKLNCNPNNLITLCRNCHCKTNYNRNYWTKYFHNEDLLA